MRGLMTLMVVVLVIGLLLGILVMQTSGMQQLFGWNQGVPAEVLPDAPITPNAQSTIQVLDKRTIVREMNALNRLETQSALVQTEFTLANEDARTIWSFFTGESLTMVGEGTVIAGVDLADIGPETVTVSEDGTYVRVELPESQVFSLTIDQENEQANAKVQDELLNKACEAGITIKAADQAQANIAQLIRALNPNVRDVDVTVSAGDCKTIVAAK
jgi:Protein of unknown function (DUF4230)